MNTLKLLKSYPTDFEAEILKAKLEREGIISVIETEDSSSMLPSLDYAKGFEIYVEPEDYERALAITNNPEDSLSDDMDTGGGD